jgi:hypothetical protein
MPEIPTVGDFLMLAGKRTPALRAKVQLFAASRQGAGYPFLGLIFSPHVVLLSFFPREFSPHNSRLAALRRVCRRAGVETKNQKAL